ncbi:unannotated protein [freshwater metagenome]|uniref:Unannotated protein n=1 Tax=freshwater metagenome TaxID=449393 RepID=A0A6J7LRC8_9ZZZZ
MLVVVVGTVLGIVLDVVFPAVAGGVAVVLGVFCADLVARTKPDITAAESSPPVTQMTALLRCDDLVISRSGYASLVSQDPSDVFTGEHVSEPLVDVFEGVFLGHHASKIKLAVAVQLHQTRNI